MISSETDVNCKKNLNLFVDHFLWPKWNWPVMRGPFYPTQPKHTRAVSRGTRMPFLLLTGQAILHNKGDEVSVIAPHVTDLRGRHETPGAQCMEHPSSIPAFQGWVLSHLTTQLTEDLVSVNNKFRIISLQYRCLHGTALAPYLHMSHKL